MLVLIAVRTLAGTPSNAGAAGLLGLRQLAAVNGLRPALEIQGASTPGECGFARCFHMSGSAWTTTTSLCRETARLLVSL